MLRDRRLSPEARFMLAYILSLPRDWRFSARWLCQELGWCKDKVWRLLREAEQHGYMRRSQRRDVNGRLGRVEYFFSDDPEVLRKPSEKPRTELPGTVNPTITKKTDIQRDQRSARARAREDLSNTRLVKGQESLRQRALPDEIRRRAREIMPGWDIDVLWKRFLAWPDSRKARRLYPAFLGWLRSIAKSGSTDQIVIERDHPCWDLALSAIETAGFPIDGLRRTGRLEANPGGKVHGILLRLGVLQGGG